MFRTSVTSAADKPCFPRCSVQASRSPCLCWPPASLT